MAVVVKAAAVVEVAVAEGWCRQQRRQQQQLQHRAVCPVRTRRDTARLVLCLTCGSQGREGHRLMP